MLRSLCGAVIGVLALILFEGHSGPGKTTVCDESETTDLEKAPLNHSFLVKALYFPIDPYLRGRMRDPKNESYIVRRFRLSFMDATPDLG